MKLNINDYIVYSGHGVGRVCEILEKKISDRVEKFFVIVINSSRMKLLIPFENANEINIRKLSSKKEANETISFLMEKDHKNFNKKNWNQRYRFYMDKIKTGDLLNVASVYKDLQSRKKSKELCFGEKKLEEFSKNLLLEEFNFIQEIDKNKVNNIFSEV